MSYFRNVVFIAALSGLAGGLVMTALQAYATVPLILKAEVYEKAGEAHSHGATDAKPAATMVQSTAAAQPAGHDHSTHTHAAKADEPKEEAWEPADGLERTSYTVLANIVTGIGFALVLVALSEFAGGIADWRAGIFWGFAGFTVFTLAPGLGLPPELPAMPAADLLQRQTWWIGTACATAAGLALIVFRRAPWALVAGIALIVVPHLIGAPQPDSHETPIPANLHHQFIVASTMTNLVFWVLLGCVAGLVRGRFTSSSEQLSLA